VADSLPEGTLTVMFTDVVGSTELTNRLGDGNARLLTRQLEAIVSREVERYSGIQVKGLGDGQMLAFTSARRAIQCGVEIQRTIRKWRGSDPTRAPLVVRIGLHTGEVIRDEDDLFGAAVNYASRVSAQGGPTM
jgi:class 3 adenylate cyclase